VKAGADDGIRTRDLRFTKPLLYQLSYVGKVGPQTLHRGNGIATALHGGALLLLVMLLLVIQFV
jgi:hypothetical protein